MVGKSDFNENPVISLDLDLDLDFGLRLRVCQNFYFGSIALSCFFETFPGGWLENPILMKTQSSAKIWTWTWTLDFDLGFVNFRK